MKREILGKCPVCDSEVKVTEIHCKKCETTIRSEFDLCKFCKLSGQQKYFIEVFVRNRGNIKEIEKELGVSYPTVRNKLDEVIAVLGYKVENQKPAANYKEVLEKLSMGEISKDEALRLINE
ncbi:MAG: DUF2089 domain-containing protein [Clostridiaceae bacterium]|nr:DUF2089 domain-containing protein [Clostridiaceae bacterium]